MHLEFPIVNQVHPNMYVTVKTTCFQKIVYLLLTIKGTNAGMKFTLVTKFSLSDGESHPTGNLLYLIQHLSSNRTALAFFQLPLKNKLVFVDDFRYGYVAWSRYSTSFYYCQPTYQYIYLMAIIIPCDVWR